MKDWSICDDADDGKHEPTPAACNDESGERRRHILTVECVHCGQTTGVPMPDDIDWG